MIKSKHKTEKKQNVKRASKQASAGAAAVSAAAVSATATMENLEPRQMLAAWSLQDRIIGLDKVAQYYPGITGTGETVVLIDQGVDYNHPELGGGFGKT